MREIQLGSHTVQSHGVKLARKHTHDWIVLIFLVVLVICLHYAPPFKRFVGKDMMTDIRYPVKQSTVPAWAVPIIAILCPVVIFMSFYIGRRDVYDLHHATLGVLFAVLITAVLTDVIKNAAGRPRPDFYWRCFPDGKQLYDQLTGDVVCHGDKSFLKDGHKSFPSGHTSFEMRPNPGGYVQPTNYALDFFSSRIAPNPNHPNNAKCELLTGYLFSGSFAGLGFLSLYLSGKMKAFDRRGHAAKLCVVFFPLLVASLVGISRVDDYRHHWQDVFVGGLLGYIMALFCYLHFFPPPYHHQGWGPYAYFDMIEESQAGNSSNLQNQQSAGGHHIGLSGQRHNGTTRNDLESGSI